LNPRFREIFADWAVPFLFGAGLVSFAPLPIWLSVYWYTALGILLFIVAVLAVAFRIRFRWFVGVTALLLAFAVASTARMLWRLDDPTERDLKRYAHKRDLEITQDELFETIWALEYVKKARGSYPRDIKELSGLLVRTDLGWDRTIGHRGTVSYFFYTRLDDNHYHLRARGADGHEFTADDVVPWIPQSDLERIGFKPMSRR